MLNLDYDFCPICNGRFIQNLGTSTIKCINNCYSEQCYGGSNNMILTCSVFGYCINFWPEDIRLVIFFKKLVIRRKIRYWKRKDRYVMKILIDDKTNSL